MKPYLWLIMVWLLVPAHGAARPNLLIILADDCMFSDIGCYGGQAHTPHIDKLATEGMRFTHCFQAAPMCSPTRHNLYTGLYPVTSGAYPNHTFVDEGTASVVQHLKPAGYRVALSGKRHVAPRSVFDFEYLGKGKNPDFERVAKFLGSCKWKEEPFCLILCSNEPHGPWNQGDPSRYDPSKLKLPPGWIDTPETRDAVRRYLAEVTYFDDQVGRALELLGKHGLQNDTLVMVLSEQGSGFPFAKWTCYDAGLQSALVVRWPGRVAAGGVSEVMVEYTDILPTMLEAVGTTPVARLDGRSFLPVLTGQVMTHKTHVYGEMTSRGILNGPEHYGIRSVRSRRYKYIWNFTPEQTFSNIVMKEAWFKSWEAAAKEDPMAAAKLSRFLHRPGEELYDMVSDPHELHNRAADPAHAATKARLRAKLQAWMESCGDEGQLTELRAPLRQTGGPGKRRGKGPK